MAAPRGNYTLFNTLWSCPPNTVDFSAFHVLSFCRNHQLFQLSGAQRLTVKGCSERYVNKLKEELKIRGSELRTNCQIRSVLTSDKGCRVLCSDGSEAVYDKCIVAVSAPDAMKMLGQEATQDEKRILVAFQYIHGDIYLHQDKSLMPQNQAAWSACNFVGSTKDKMCLTYWLNVMQQIPEKNQPLLMTVNPPHQPENTLFRWSTSHYFVPSVSALEASHELISIQGKRGIWFCGAFQGSGSHEDGLKAGMAAAHSILGRSFAPLTSPKQMVLSLTEPIARPYIITFLKSFISGGYITLLKDGGIAVNFEGSDKECAWKTALRVLYPQFYSKHVL